MEFVPTPSSHCGGCPVASLILHTTLKWPTCGRERVVTAKTVLPRSELDLGFSYVCLAVVVTLPSRHFIKEGCVISGLNGIYRPTTRTNKVDHHSR